MLVASLAVLLLGCGVSKTPSSDAMLRDSAALREVFPAIEALHVTTFRNQDWCRNLAYPRGNFAFTDSPDNTDTCYLFQGDAQPFDDQANGDFELVADALAKTNLTVRIANYIEFDADGHVAGASFDLEGAGLSGYWRYVYDPGAPLPEDMEGELQNTRIDADWYFEWEDWM